MLALVLLAPAALAEPGLPASDGLTTACGSSSNDNPCRMARIIRDTTLSSGTTRTYRGDYLAVGTVVVESGATAIFDDAHVTFTSTSNGILVKGGGTLRVLDSVFDEDAAGGSAFVVLGETNSNVEFLRSTLHSGGGMILRTDAAKISGSLFTLIDVGLRLEGVTLTIANNRFVGNVVAVNQTGGSPTLRANRFEGGEYCVRDWVTNPTIVGNVFVGCHVGILHQRSHSYIADNQMSDDAFPPGSGVEIEDTLSPILENNTITNYGVGVKVTNARAFVRNNSIHGNVGDGILVRQNSGEMDIQGNVIRNNGGHGVRLVDASHVPVSRNSITDNAGDGIRVEGSAVGVVLVDNVVARNGGDGVDIAAHNVRVTGGSANGNAGHGIALRGASGVVLERVDAMRNRASGVLVENAQASIVRVNASENNHSGFRYDPKGPLAVFGPTDLDHVRAMRNNLSGLHNVAGNATFANNAWFEGNVHAGVDNDDVASLIDVRNSYWGDPSGPTHVANPGGKGDRIEGGALFHPFRTSPPP